MHATFTTSLTFLDLTAPNNRWRAWT